MPSSKRAFGRKRLLMIKHFITRENLGQRVLQFCIIVAHLALLRWILYTLYEGGTLPFTTLMFHFGGISVAGGLLIFTCAQIYKRQYQKELRKHGQNAKLDS